MNDIRTWRDRPFMAFGISFLGSLLAGALPHVFGYLLTGSAAVGIGMALIMEGLIVPILFINRKSPHVR